MAHKYIRIGLSTILGRIRTLFLIHPLSAHFVFQPGFATSRPSHELFLSLREVGSIASTHHGRIQGGSIWASRLCDCADDPGVSYTRCPHLRPCFQGEMGLRRLVHALRSGTLTSPETTMLLRSGDKARRRLTTVSLTVPIFHRVFGWHSIRILWIGTACGWPQR